MKTLNNALKRTFLIMLYCLAMVNTAYADFASSDLATGTKSLISDVSTWLVLICPVVAAAAAVFFLIRRAMADEQDGKMWNRRIQIAIICGVAGTLVSGIISLISSYY